MSFRVPLLFPSALVVSRLSIRLTRRKDPDGAGGPVAGGYDPILREPYPYEDVTTTTKDGEEVKRTTVTYLPKVRIPCQVEVKDFEELRQTFQGDAPITQMVFVLHNKDLRRLGLLEPVENPCDGMPCIPKLKTNDRVDRVEVLGSPGKIAHPLKEKLYIFEIQPGSWGMGPTGQDLQIVFTSNRAATPTP